MDRRAMNEWARCVQKVYSTICTCPASTASATAHIHSKITMLMHIANENEDVYEDALQFMSKKMENA